MFGKMRRHEADELKSARHVASLLRGDGAGWSETTPYPASTLTHTSGVKIRVFQATRGPWIYIGRGQSMGKVTAENARRLLERAFADWQRQERIAAIKTVLPAAISKED